MTTDPRHSIYLVPVRIDLDGTLLIPCPGLDGDIYLDVDCWMGWCSACRVIVGEQPVPGTIGLQDVDGLDDAAYEAVQRWEHILTAQHRAALAAGCVREGRPVRVTNALLESWGVARRLPEMPRVLV